MPLRSADALEFFELLEVLKRYVASPLGEWQIEEIRARPLHPSKESAKETLAELAEAIDFLAQAKAAAGRSGTPVTLRFSGLRDMRPAVETMGTARTVLEGPEIQGLIDVLDRAEETRLRLAGIALRAPRLADYAERLADFRPLLRDLSGKIQPNGEVADSASAALAKIRRQIEQQRNVINKTLEQFVRSHYQEGLLQEDYVTIRNGRLVVPVKTSWKWKVKGVIHGTSSTGQTVFVEPVESIELNNRLVKMIEDEHAEVRRVLIELTDRMRRELLEIATAIELLAKLELLFAKARFAADFRCAIPSFNTDDSFRLRLARARHPLLEDVLGRAGRSVSPVSLTLDEDRRVLLISGPNAGGKTVVLKTVGLLALMAQAGLPVPADEAEFPWFDQVLADIGDLQSIAESLSTFSAHIEQLKAMMQLADERSLVLMDELGAATDPEEGGALGVAVIEHFLERGGFTIASTHLPALKTYAANAAGVENAAVGFDEETLAPNYKLRVGVPGQSAGLEMARRLGVPDSLIARARQAMSTQAEEAVRYVQQLHGQIEEYDTARNELRRAEAELARKHQALAREMEQREAAKVTELERRVEKLMRRFEAEHRATIDKLADVQAARRAAKDVRRQATKRRIELKQEIQSATQQASAAGQDAEPVVEQAELSPGRRVRLGEIGAVGHLVRQLASGHWEVEVGSLRMRVEQREITEVLPDAPPLPAGSPSRITLKMAARDVKSLSEINVIGRDSETAREEVDKFLDDAVLAEVERVRVIHGHGMQVLRKTLWKMFASHPHVERYYQAEQREGGAGATIVEVKQ